MNFDELVLKVNNESLEKNDVVSDIISNINITPENFDKWVTKVFSEDINKFDMSKLPYLIDGLYKSNDKFKFTLCCMFIESTCYKLKFITRLDRYPVFKEKFETMLHTLVTVYNHTENEVANCMSAILINNDPKLEFLNAEQRSIIENATIRKLKARLNYIKGGNIDPIIYFDLEMIIDLACYMNNQSISDLISEIDELEDNKNADLYILKYKLIHNMDINQSKFNRLKDDNKKLLSLYRILEDLGLQEKYLGYVTQEQLAREDMIRWLSHPTELGSAPDMIELLGEFTVDDKKFFAYKFKKNGFSIEEELIGISGGYPLNTITAKPSGHTFSKFEKVEKNWKVQAINLAIFIINIWKEKFNDKNKSYYSKSANFDLKEDLKTLLFSILYTIVFGGTGVLVFFQYLNKKNIIYLIASLLMIIVAIFIIYSEINRIYYLVKKYKSNKVNNKKLEKSKYTDVMNMNGIDVPYYKSNNNDDDTLYMNPRQLFKADIEGSIIQNLDIKDCTEYEAECVKSLYKMILVCGEFETPYVDEYVLEDYLKNEQQVIDLVKKFPEVNRLHFKNDLDYLTFSLDDEANLKRYIEILRRSFKLKKDNVNN